jgi:hypothetical protein
MPQERRRIARLVAIQFDFPYAKARKCQHKLAIQSCHPNTRLDAG